LQIEAEPFKRDPERAKRFVNAVINAYTTRFMANDPKFNIHDRNDIFVPLFDAVRELWQEIPVLRFFSNIHQSNSSSLNNLSVLILSF
jgi:hypothetical protein